MAMNVSERMIFLRPDYDFSLPSLASDTDSRGIVYRAIHPGSHVLDVGCDTGRFGEALLEKNCIVDGVEPWLPAAEKAQVRLRKVFTRTIQDEQAFDGLENYDAVLFLCVLEHLLDPWAALKGALRTLHPGGTIHVVVPNVAHVSVLRRLLQGQFEYTDHGTMDRTHLRWFTRKSLRQSLEDAGFVDIEVTTVTAIPWLNRNSFLPKLLTKLFGRILPDLSSVSIIAQGVKPH